MRKVDSVILFLKTFKVCELKTVVMSSECAIPLWVSVMDYDLSAMIPCLHYG